MIPVRGLRAGEITFDRVVLPCKRGVYFSAVALSVWDNIHGPKVLTLWTGKPPPTESETDGAGVGGPPTPSTETLLAVVNYSLNDEAGRIDKLDGVETKFYCLRKYDIIASAFIFSIELSRSKPDVFSFLLLLPYSEMSAYLARHRFCEAKVQGMLEEYLILPLKSMLGKGSMKDRVMKVVPKLTKPLKQFTQLMYSIRHHCLPEKIDIAQTFLGRDLERRADMKTFLHHAIMSHLQSSGYTVVVGEDEGSINKMLCTLGLFLSARERRTSRLAAHADSWAYVSHVTENPEGGAAETEPEHWECFNYEPDLFLQGYVLSSGESHLPFSRAELWQNRLPCTIIHMDCREVRVVDPPGKVPVFIRRKEDPPEAIRTRKTSVPLKELAVYEAKDYSSRIVTEFLEHLRLLPPVGGAREAYIGQLLRMVKLKALALTKYVDAEPKSTIQQAQEQLVNALALRGAAADRPKVNLASLQQDLSIETTGDLYLVLAFAEKIRANSYLDVLGDPQQQAEAVLKEFETF